jgi:hypothetical protein
LTAADFRILILLSPVIGDNSDSGASEYGKCPNTVSSRLIGLLVATGGELIASTTELAVGLGIVRENKKPLETASSKNPVNPLIIITCGFNFILLSASLVSRRASGISSSVRGYELCGFLGNPALFKFLLLFVFNS